MNAIAVGFRLLPFSYIRVTENALPNAMTFFQTCDPLAFIKLAIGPGVGALSVRLIVQELSKVHVAITIALHAFAFACVLVPLAFEYSCLLVDHNSETLSFVLLQLASVDAVVVTLYAEVRQFCQFIIVKEITFHRVVFVNAHGFPLIVIDEDQVLLDLIHTMLLGLKNSKAFFIKVRGVSEPS